MQAQGDPPLSYQWRKGGTNCNEPGATSPTLTIDTVDFGSSGNYDVVVSNACGSVVSGPANLDVCVGVQGCSPADLTGDGVIDALDIQRFIEVLIGCCL